MLRTTTRAIAKILNTDCTADVEFRGVYTDTRKPMDGGLFVALIGANFDAHDYTNQAKTAGAVAIVVSRRVVSDLPLLLVKNTQTALVELARWHLNNINPKVVAITGSNGKTTTKNMLANILRLQAPTLKTRGNLNNHFGVPITLLGLARQHRYCVVEMGANHLGEIAYLRNIVQPDIALVTNTLDAHIGEFGGLDNLVKAKGEIYQPTSKNIVNTATAFTGDISFGEGGDIFASNINNNNFDLNILTNKISLSLQLLGRHNIDNALAASACAHALGIDINKIKQGLENTRAEKGRLDIIKQNGRTIIDDTYNASPTSTRYALEILAEFNTETVAILGQMAQLGEDSDQAHKKIGQYAKSLDIDYLYSIGENAQKYQLQHFDNEENLLKKISDHKDATLLFKGSRIAKLDQLITKIPV